MVNPLLVLGGAAAAVATAAYFLLAPEDGPITSREQRTAVLHSPDSGASVRMLSRMKRKEKDPGYVLVVPSYAVRPPGSPGFAWALQPGQPGRYGYWEYKRKPVLPERMPGTVKELPPL